MAALLPAPAFPRLHLHSGAAVPRAPLSLTWRLTHTAALDSAHTVSHVRSTQRPPNKHVTEGFKGT